MKSTEKNKIISDYIREGNLQEVTRLIEEDNGLLNAKDVDVFGYTPLYTAAMYGKTEIALRLIELGADVNTKNLDGNTPLIVAAGNRNTEIAQKLIERQANVNAKDGDGNTPLHIAARTGNTEIVQKLIELVADVNTKNNLGNTPLTFASKLINLESYAKITLKLIDAGANFNIRIKNSETPLHIAARAGNTEIVQKLIKKGAKVNAKDKHGDTPLVVAIRSGKTELAIELIELGADVNAKNNSGITPLLYAASSGEAKIVQKLIELGADVNAKNNSGITILLYAARNGKTEIVKELMKSVNCNLSQVDYQGNSIFTFYMNNNEMLELLFRNGADTGLYAAELAKRSGDDALKKLSQSSQSSHYTDKIFIDKVYPKIRDNASTYTLDEIKAKLEQLIDLNDNDFKSLLNTLIGNKEADVKSKIGQGNSFIEKIKEIDDKTAALKSYLKTCLENAINTLNHGHGQNNPNELLGKIISEIEKKEAAEQKDYLLRLTIELIDSGSMYSYGGASCLSGTMNKVLSVLVDLIPSEEKKVGSKEYDIGSVIFNDVAFLDNFAKSYKDTWPNFKDFQKAQALRKTFYDLLRGNEEGFTEVFGYCKFQGFSENLFNEPQNIARFKGELEYTEISSLFAKFLGEIDKNLDAKISGYFVKEELVASKQDIKASSNQAIKAKLLDKIEEGDLSNKVSGISAKDIAEIVKDGNLNDPRVLCKVLRVIDKGDSFEGQMVSDDSYKEFIKGEDFAPQQQMGIPQQSSINPPVDDEFEMINTSSGKYTSYDMHLAGGHHEHSNDQHQ